MRGVASVETAYMLKESAVEAVSRAAAQTVDTPFCIVDAGMNVRLMRDRDGTFGPSGFSRGGHVAA